MVKALKQVEDSEIAGQKALPQMRILRYLEEEQEEKITKQTLFLM
jgi:hypothetical protein